MVKNLISRGIMTLTILLLLTSTMLVVMLLNDDILRLYTGLLTQRKNYVIASISLQEKSAAEKQKICDTLPLTFAGNSYLAAFKLDEKQSELQQFVWCERKALIKQSPKKGINEDSFKDFINENLYSEFIPQYHSPTDTQKSTNLRIYWLSGRNLQWQLAGDISAIVIADDDLTIQGKGKISGAVIVKGKLTQGADVQIVYKKDVVTTLVQQLSYWRLKEKSWHDFIQL